MAKKPNKPFVPSNASTWNPEEGEENLVINNNGDLNIWLGREDLQEYHERKDSKQGSNAIENLKQSFYTTPVSKKVGNGNARRHGAYSNGLLPWESEEEFR